MRRVTGDINRRTNVLKNSTIREFDGGWNVIDSEYVLDTRFSVRLRNMYRAADGTLRVRQGTRLFADLEDSLGADVVNMEYFNGFIVAVGTNGNLSATDGTGMSYLIWDNNIAGLLPGNPAGWGSTDFVSFTPFKNELTVWNGVDKPLKISTAMGVDYLKDLATLSNGNTPRGRYSTTHNQYVCVAGVPGEPSTLYISNKGAAGTWPGDAGTDATKVDLAAYIAVGDPEIIGVISFRDKLLVYFDATVIVMTLGTYNSAVHVPTVDDVIASYGAVSHRTLQSLGDDVLFADIVGVPSVRRALFTGTLQPNRVSQYIDPEIQKDMARLSEASLQDRVLSIYNRLDGQYMLFVPNSDNEADTLETRGFVYTYIEALKVKAWSEFTEMKWAASTRSQEGRIFFADGDKLFLLGNDNDPISSDRVGLEEPFSDGTVFTDLTGWTPVTDSTDMSSGIPILFDWELPWADFDKRMEVKVSKYLAMDVIGTGRYTVDMFVDNLYADRTDLGEPYSDGTLHTDGFGFYYYKNEPVRTPELTLDFVGGDALGFGADFGQYFGGGRNSREERLYAWPATFKIAKLRLHGYTNKPLRFASLSLSYQNGSIRRG